MTSPAIEVHAAGSLRTALTALTAAFTEKTGVSVRVLHGPAGLLRAGIEEGARPDLFLSADLAHPLRLHEAGLAGSPVLFARNRMVALTRTAAGISSENFMNRLLDPNVAIATSTPVNDPSGDYAWAIFRAVDRARPGTFQILAAKAQKLVGGAMPVVPQPSYDAVADALAKGSIDIFFGYATGLAPLAERVGALTLVEIPAAVSVAPEYGLAMLKDAAPQACAFALFIMSLHGQRLLQQAGFSPVNLPSL